MTLERGTQERVRLTFPALSAPPPSSSPTGRPPLSTSIPRTGDRPRKLRKPLSEPSGGEIEAVGVVGTVMEPRKEA